MRFWFTGCSFDRPRNRQGTLRSETQSLRESTTSPPPPDKLCRAGDHACRSSREDRYFVPQSKRLVKRELLLLRNPNGKLDSVSSPKHHCRHKECCVASRLPGSNRGESVRQIPKGLRSLPFQLQSRTRPKFDNSRSAYHTCIAKVCEAPMAPVRRQQIQGTQLRYEIEFVVDMDKAVKFYRDVLGLKGEIRIARLERVRYR